MKFLDTFSGIGGFHLALVESIGKENIECIGFSEIDKFAKIVYKEHFEGSPDLGDITKIDIENLPDFDLLTGGFPCQDVSVAGKQNLKEGGRTILVEYLLQILEKKQPKYFIFENVKGLLNKKFKLFFESILDRVKNAGYDVKFQVLNTKDFGLPQNRQRVFIVGKLGVGTLDYFNFPEGKELNIFLKDILEKEVDSKYNLSEKQLENIKNSSFNQKTKIIQNKKYCNTLYIRDYKDSKCINIKLPDFTSFSQDNTFCGLDDIVPTLTAGDGGNRPKTYTRKLMPEECIKLQGFPKKWSTEFVSNSQAYKQAGNAVSIPVVKAIFDNLLK